MRVRIFTESTKHLEYHRDKHKFSSDEIITCTERFLTRSGLRLRLVGPFRFRALSLLARARAFAHCLQYVPKDRTPPAFARLKFVLARV